MATFKTVLRTSKPITVDGESEQFFPIWLRVTNRTQVKFVSYGLITRQSDWVTESGRFLEMKGRKTKILQKSNGKYVAWLLNGSTVTAKSANDHLAIEERRAEEIVKGFEAKKQDWSFSTFESEFRWKSNETTFVKYVEDMKSRYREAGRHKRIEILSDTFKALERYAKSAGKDLSKMKLQDIDVKFLNGFVTYSQNKGNSINTINIRLTEVRTLLNSAIADGHLSESAYPFSMSGKRNDGKRDNGIKIKQGTPSRTERYLPLSYMKKLANVELADKRLDCARHLFLFSFHCWGINWTDMSKLTAKNIETKYVPTDGGEDIEIKTIRYIRSKTKEQYEIKITPSIQRELDWFQSNVLLYQNYLLPIIRKQVDADKLVEYVKGSRQRANDALLEIADICEFPDSLKKGLSFYSARHSFAMGLHSSGESMEIISQALGHKSVETTKHYVAKFGVLTMAEHTELDLSN